MTDIKDIETKVDAAKAAVAPTVDKVVTWRDRYLQWVSTHPKTVSVLLAVAVIWAALATIKV